MRTKDWRRRNATYPTFRLGERLPTAAGGHHNVSELPNATREHGGDRSGGGKSGRPQTVISRHIESRIGPRSWDFVQFQVGGAIGIGGVVTVIIDRYGHVYVGGGIIAGFGIDTGASFGWTQDPMTPDEFSIDQSIQGGGFNFDVGYGLGLSFGISDDWYNTTNVGVSLPTAAISYAYMFDEQQIRDFFK